MNKQEALQKIKELEEFVKGCDRRHPDIKMGQLYKHRDGDVYMVIRHSSLACTNEKFQMIGVHNIDGQAEGCIWNKDMGFGLQEDKFTYIGMAADLLTIKT